MNHAQRRSRVVWIGSALSIALLIGGAAVLFLHKSPSQRLMRTAASQAWRPVEGRLTGFAYRPRPVSRASADLTVLRDVAGAVVGDAGGEAHTAAVATLLNGKTADAVTALEKLVAREPQNAGYWSDLAAAQLEHAAATDDVRAIARALAASDHAIALQSNSAEGLFNRGLALDALGLRFASREAWRRYLAVDTNSAWAAEARQRFTAANAPTRDELWQHETVALDRALDRQDSAAVDRIVAEFPLQARAAAETIHLPAWGDAFIAGDVALAEKALARAKLIAAALKKHNGDSLLNDAVNRLGSDAARGFQAYRQARADNVARKIKESFDEFTGAERAFAAAKNPMELSAAYYRANAMVDLRMMEESKAAAAQLEPRVDPSYRSLHAHLLWLHARHTGDAGHHYESLLATRTAREAFERLGELDFADRLRSGEGAMYARLGRDREAWQTRRAALAGAAASGRWNLIESAIDAVAHEEMDGANPDVARSLLNLEVSTPTVLPLTRFDAELWLASLDARNGQHPLDTRAARIAAARIPDEKQRDDAFDDLRLADGMSIRESNPAAAEKLLSAVIDRRTNLKLATNLPSIYLQRAHIRRALKNEADAERDLREAISLIESRRGTIGNDTLRDAFLGTSGDAYNELGDLLLARGDWMGAFEIAERARARVLLDKAGRTAQPAAALAATIPPRVVGVHYTSYPTRTLIVIFEHGRATHSVVEIDRNEIQSLRDELLAKPDSKPAARRLYDLLIAPLQDRLGGGRELVIVPDESTYGIPFAALRNHNEEFLIEQTAISIAPTGAAIATEPLTLSPKHSRVTIVADPAFSQSLFPNLTRLPAARDDADSIKSIFASATPLIGDQATRRALTSAMQECDVLHIAAHALSSGRDASLSLIALTPENDDNGLLYLDDVRSLSLPKRPLVVLAGCQTALFGGGKGSIRSLADAFLAAGSRAVLGTIKDVDDAHSSELTTRFYRNLAAGATAPDALREAQLAALRSGKSSDWAAFQLHVGVPATSEKTSRSAVTE
jgi:CHAT domain-containing protein